MRRKNGELTKGVMDKPSVYPNLLFIMTDQQRFDALSGHEGWIKTPNLDKLAASGMDLLGHYSQAPVCVPSRCSIFSGRYPHTHGAMENDGRLSADEEHLFKVLRRHGYHISYCGKNHLLAEEDMIAAVDRFNEFGSCEGLEERRSEYEELEQESLGRLSTLGSHASGMYHDFPDEVTTAGMIANESIRNVSEAPKDGPWCSVVSFTDPHVPHLAPRRFESWYSDKEIPLPDWDPKDYEGKHHRMRIKRDVQLAQNASEEEKRHYLAVYGAMCSYVDEQVGRILEALEAREDAERTIRVYVSDHGDFCWRHGLVKKDLLLYDDLLHVPALISCPDRIDPGLAAKALSEHVDLMPTLLELSGIEIPDTCEGRSLAPLFSDPNLPHRDQVHGEICYEWMRSNYDTAEAFLAAWERDQLEGGPLEGTANYNIPGDHNKCVRSRRWKYIQFGDGFEELYDLQEDPGEARNLVKESRYAKVLMEMRRRLVEWSEGTHLPTLDGSRREG